MNDFVGCGSNKVDQSLVMLVAIRPQRLVMEIKYCVILLTCIHLGTSIPMKLLRVPKIYNALITTNQKLLPSEAMPATTGPVFQPIGLSADPVVLNPGALKEGSKEPLVFYPRYNIYHQLPQSVFPYTNVFQPPPIVVPAMRSQVEEEVEEKREAAPETGSEGGFVTNNSPNGGIPNVPPPPPPVASQKEAS